MDVLRYCKECQKTAGLPFRVRPLPQACQMSGPLASHGLPGRSAISIMLQILTHYSSFLFAGKGWW